MKYVLIFAAVAVISCQNPDSEKVKQLEKRIDSMQQAKEQLVSIQDAGRKADSALVQEYKGVLGHGKALSGKKYCYVYIETIEPERDANFAVVFEKQHYASQIFEEPNFDEERKYMLLDNCEKWVKNAKFTIKDAEFSSHGHCKVTSRVCYSFNTYKEASEHRREKEE